MTHKILKFTICALIFFAIGSQSYAQEAPMDKLLFESSEYLRLGQPAEALDLLNKHIEAFGEEPEFLNNLAIAYLGNNNPEKALSILRMIVEEDPLFSIVGHNLLEMELGAAGVEADQINPVLFVQSVNSFSAGVPVPEQSIAAVPALANVLLEGALQSIVQSWADAWSNKDFSRYIAHYATTFKPQNGLSLAVWREGRAIRLAKPGEIKVTIQNLKVFPDGISPRVQFDQSYQSTGYSDVTRKEIIFTQDDNRWKIGTETIIKTY